MRTYATAALALALASGVPASRAQPASGEQVYKDVCTACHATGLEKAPKLGDRKAWAPLIKEGQSKLTADGWIGVRAMPPRGGKAELSLEDFSRAAAYMARAAGANWKDPDAALLDNIRKRIKARQDAIEAKAKATK
ncbi:MAG: c-type cytochrome [Betaproteobacteria bacterium]